VGVGGLLGWWIVSWVVSLLRQQKRPPVDIVDGRQRSPLDLTRDDPPAALPGPAAGAWGGRARDLSVAEISAQWASILGVAESASAAEVEAAYHARLAECDRTRFAATASDAEKAEAQTVRARVTQAYEFARPLKT